MSRILLALAPLLLITGCSYMRSSQRLNLAPFAEHTISLAMDIEYNAADTGRIPYLRRYQNDPVVLSYREEWGKVRQRLHITPAEMDTIIVKIREQQKPIGGLREAQPLIDEVARLSDEIFDEVGAAIDATRDYLYQKIEEENADVGLYEELIRKSRYRVFRETLLMSRYRAGDRSGLQEVWQLDPQLLELVASPDTVTVEELQVLEERLLFKMKAVAEFNQQVQTDIDRYHAMHAELAQLYAVATHQLRKARVIMIVWARAHSDLARGITDPAKVNLFDLTKKAAKMVI